jgi:catalase
MTAIIPSLSGTLKIRADLESDLAKELFQPGATYDAVIRFSSGNPKTQADYFPEARGMAVKLLSEGTLPRDDRPEAVIKQG